jgi:DNA-binding NarL/FixJ family response regulator
VPRPEALAASVEIMLAKRHLEDARTGAEALARRASEVDVPLLHAMAAQALGAVRLAEGEAKSALALLREAWARWQQLDAPYESARVRVLVAAACRELGDRDGADIHLDAARAVLERLGARLDVDRLEPRSATPAREAPAGLTTREREVLALVASGKTNRQIAAELFISEHTVARHLSNIFNKIGVTSRTAAGAFAFEHDLVR